MVSCARTCGKGLPFPRAFLSDEEKWTREAERKIESTPSPRPSRAPDTEAPRALDCADVTPMSGAALGGSVYFWSRLGVHPARRERMVGVDPSKAFLKRKIADKKSPLRLTL